MRQRPATRGTGTPAGAFCSPKLDVEGAAALFIAAAFRCLKPSDAWLVKIVIFSCAAASCALSSSVDVGIAAAAAAAGPTPFAAPFDSSIARVSFLS